MFFIVTYCFAEKLRPVRHKPFSTKRYGTVRTEGFAPVETLQYVTVQSHSPCKPGVAGSIPGFSKNNDKNQLPG